MKDVVRLTRRHFDGIVARTQTRQTNGFIEAINGLFQAAKRKAREYARFETMRTVLSLIAGKLRLLRLQLACPLKAITHSVFSRAPYILTPANPVNVRIWTAPILSSSRQYLSHCTQQMRCDTLV
ncbi:hypothetical protein PTKU15_84420 [Paraburkholderia terrae]|nr:hypothetical protein PTKU15_84420 [Paraburkholderia terrae]